MRLATENEARIFQRVMPNPNFMTPHLEAYFRNSTYVIELTSGKGIDGRTIWGVSVVDMVDLRYQPTPLSAMCESHMEALNHIKSLGEGE